MAVLKCKDCGKGIETKKKACPHCGAKQKQSISIVMWFILVLVVLGVTASIATEYLARMNTD